ncbi:hydroxyacylglutathione hydrolase cytoplasmic-like [Hevea brasiliensis]|uniref:hydroxyacylglutathione hydrolase cytoplasmic-like n=1 Tax=Hevea brasiliensis TaxID=3981 RepID=UPI0025F38561|nr:hydroxyacylglutathione hydrolase cytoplasmic-like [Hevea brasiliensis]
MAPLGRMQPSLSIAFLPRLLVATTWSCSFALSHFCFLNTVWTWESLQVKKMKIFHVPCLEDNFACLIIDESNKEAAVVDPVKPNKILQVANQHHANINHTKGHISYFVTGKEGEDPAVFTGDTLFIAGCGKFVEGTAEQMYRSLCQTLGSLPKPTQVYCGHEYTVKNLQFALTVELDNVKKQQKLSWAQQKRQAGLPTIPSSFEEEWETNPFLRVDLPDLQARVGCKSPVETLQKTRQLKDNWRG